MMPGIIPSLLIGPAFAPLHDAYVTPEPASWYGSHFNYYTDVYVEHSGGVEPFTYEWRSTAWDYQIASPFSRATRLYSESGLGGVLECVITDAVGQQTTARGNILFITRS